MKKIITLALGVISGVTIPATAMENKEPISEENKKKFFEKIDQKTYFEMFEKIVEKYEETLEESDPKNKWFITERTKYLDKIFSALEIKIPKENMLKIFGDYKVIVHRPPENETLIIGCGNLPPYDLDMCLFGIDDWGDVSAAQEYRENHAHKGCDTLDPDAVRDPTLVGSLDWNNIVELYKEHFNNHKYNKIHFEGYFPFNVDTNKGLLKKHENDFEELLNVNGTVSFDELGTIFIKGEGWTYKGKQLIGEISIEGESEDEIDIKDLITEEDEGREEKE